MKTPLLFLPLLVACYGPNGVVSVTSVKVSVLTRIDRAFAASYVDDDAIVQRAKDNVPFHSDFSTDFEPQGAVPGVKTCGFPVLYWQLDQAVQLPEQDGTVQLVTVGGIRQDGIGSGHDTLELRTLDDMSNWVVDDQGKTTDPLSTSYDLPESFGSARATETRTVTFGSTQVDVTQYDSCGDFSVPIY